DDAAEPLAGHGQQQRAGDVEEAVQADIDDPAPAFEIHARHGAVVVDPGVVDQDLQRPVSEQGVDCLRGRLVVGDVEGHRLGTAALVVDGLHEFLRAGQVAVGVHDDVHAIGGQPGGDGAPKVAAGTGDEGTFVVGNGHGVGLGNGEPGTGNSVVVGQVGMTVDSPLAITMPAW